MGENIGFLAELCCVVRRFLRHVPVVYVDYPGPASLTQIYGTFNRAMLRLIPTLRTYAEPLTAAMVEFYTMSQVTRMRLLTISILPYFILHIHFPILYSSEVFFVCSFYMLAITSPSFIPTGAFHPGHSATLHLLSQRDDPLG